MAQQIRFSGTTLITQGFLSSLTPCLGASVFILQRYDSKQGAATQTRSSKRSHTCSLAVDAGKAGRTRTRPGCPVPRRATAASPWLRGTASGTAAPARSPGAASAPFPGPPPASANRRSRGLAEGAKERRRGCGGGRACPSLWGTRSPLDGRGRARPGRGCSAGRAARHSPAPVPHAPTGRTRR